MAQDPVKEALESVVRWRRAGPGTLREINAHALRHLYAVADEVLRLRAALAAAESRVKQLEAEAERPRGG